MIIGVERERDDGELETDDGEPEDVVIGEEHPRKKTRTADKNDSPSD